MMARILLLLLLLASPVQASYNVWLDNSLTKYRQDGEEGTNGPSSISINIAKNEIESFQVIIYADGETLTSVDVSIPNLTKGSDAISDIYIYKQWYNYTKSVDVKGVAEDWVDQGSNIWRKNIGSTPYVWSGVTGAYHDQDVGFYYGGIAQKNWHDGNNETTLDALYKWRYDGTYLYVYSPSNPASYFNEIHAPNRKSRIDFPSGMYPDALIPKVDRYYHETRNAFPFTVSSGKVQGIWVDIGTTTSTPAGTYTGTVTVTAQGKEPVQLTITVNVLDFVLPSTSSFKSQFVLTQAPMTFAHGLGYAAASAKTPEAISLANLYAKSFLYHKMGIVLGGGVPGYGSAYLTWDDTTNTLTIPTWEPWYSIIKDVYSGTAITSGPYTGAKMAAQRIPYHWPTEADVNIPVAKKETAMRQYVQLVYDKFEAEGWDPWNYLIMAAYHDEPKCDTTTLWRGETWNKCDAIIDEMQDLSSVDTGGKGMFKRSYVNTKKVAGLEGVETYGFHSTNNYSYVCPGWDRTCTSGGTVIPRSSYTADNVFGYLACDNNGCWMTGSTTTVGQIDWSADATAVMNRMPGFIWAKYDLTGTIYWGTTVQDYTVNNVNGAGAPFDSVWNFGSNGDGFLVYPGVASATDRTLPSSTPIIGGTHDIPIESIRMKHVRDAIEDWEYYKMAKSVDSAAALTALNTVFSDTDILDAYWNITKIPSTLLSARASLGSILSGAEIPTCSLDGIQNGDETGVDCGGSCPACASPSAGLIPLGSDGYPISVGGVPVSAQ